MSGPMRKARPLVVTVIAVAITVSLLAGAIGRPRPHAMSRFKVDIEGSTYWPNFSEAEGKALSLS